MGFEKNIKKPQFQFFDEENTITKSRTKFEQYSAGKYILFTSYFYNPKNYG